MDLIGKRKQSRESTCKKDRGGSGWLELPRLLPRMISLEDKNERIRPKRTYQYQTVTFLRSLKRRIYSRNTNPLKTGFRLPLWLTLTPTSLVLTSTKEMTDYGLK